VRSSIKGYVVFPIVIDKIVNKGGVPKPPSVRDKGNLVGVPQIAFSRFSNMLIFTLPAGYACIHAA
jgi:hypothetical protein